MSPHGTRLEILLLGPMQVDLEGNPPPQLTADKVRALLAYLAVNPEQPHRREKLAGLLWPESPESAARASLRNALTKLRDAIDDRNAQPPLLEISRHTITFRPNQNCRIDSADFTQAVRKTSCSEHAIDHLTHATSLYRAPFMEGFTLADCPDFEEWQTVQREHYQTLAVAAFDRLAAAHEARGELEQAIGALRRQVMLESWLEEGHRRLMELLARAGRRSEALAQFRTCQELLSTEMGLTPDAETVALYERL
jgi:DNA-binding SARP family transcriptional activator